MKSFKTKQLKPTKRVCLRLREAREEKGISLKEISQKTKISQKYIEAMEDCRFDDIPFAAIYKKNFIKRYADAISIDAKGLVDQFLLEETKQDIIGDKEPKTVKNTEWFNLPHFTRTAGSISIFVLVMGYLGFQVKNIVEPPELQVYSPTDGFVTEEQLITVFGETKGAANLSINGKEIGYDSEGRFEEKITLASGINTIIISAQKKHGKISSETRHVILKEKNKFSLLNN